MSKKTRSFFPDATIIETEDGVEAYEQMQAIRPDLALIDIQIPRLSGVELIEKCYGAYDCMFLIISGYADFEYAQSAIRFGAIGYLVKPVQNEELQEAFSKAVDLSAAFQDNARRQGRSATLQAEHQRLVFEKLINHGDGRGASPLTDEERRAIEGDRPYLPTVLRVAELDVSDEEEAATLRAIKQQMLATSDRPPIFGNRLIIVSDYQDDRVLFVLATGDATQRLADLTQQLRSWAETCGSLFDVTLHFRVGSIVYRPDELTPELSRLVQTDQGDTGSSAGEPDTRGPAGPGVETGVTGTLRLIAAYVTQNCDQEVSLKTVAAKFSVSSSHLSRLFRKSFGVTYSTYVVQRRMEKAKRLLAGTTLPIGEIAEQCGYSDVHYFYRVFRGHVGTTPVAFRNFLQSDCP